MLNRREVTYQTITGKKYFQIDERDGNFIVYKLSSNFLLRKKSIKIGETKTWVDALSLARLSVTSEILDMEIS